MLLDQHNLLYNAYWTLVTEVKWSRREVTYLTLSSAGI